VGSYRGSTTRGLLLVETYYKDRSRTALVPQLSEGPLGVNAVELTRFHVEINPEGVGVPHPDIELIKNKKKFFSTHVPPPVGFFGPKKTY